MSINIDNNVKNQGNAPAIAEGLFANRPSPGQPGRLYLSTDTNVMYLDTGSSWVIFLSQASVPSGLTPIGTAYQNLQVNSAGTALQYATLGGSLPITVTNVGTITSVSMSVATNSQDGYLTSTNFNTFNGKIGGSGTANSLAKFSASGTIANSNVTDSGTLIQFGVTAYTTAQIGIGSSPSGTQSALHIDRNITGGVQSYGITNQGTIQSGVTSTATYFQSTASTVATAFTVSTVIGFKAIQGTFGAGSTVSAQYGFYADNTLQGATNNYGFFASLNTGWNFYGANSAKNFFGGTTYISATTDSGSGAVFQANGGINFLNMFNRQSASYTLALTDQNKIVEMNVAGANTLTIPNNSTVALPIGTEIAGVQYNTGQVTVTPASGVTLRSVGGALKSSAQYAFWTMVKVGTNEWYVTGSLSV
jgi:hypothetical protein